MVKKILASVLALVIFLSMGSLLVVSAAEGEWVLDYNYKYAGAYAAKDADVPDKEGATNSLIPLDSAQKYKDKDSMRLNIKKETEWWICLLTVSSSTVKLQDYVEKGSLQFALKGETGGEEFGIGFKNGSGSSQTNASIKVKATTEWQVINIPIKQIKDTHPFFEPSQIDAFIMMSTQSNVMKVWVADVRVIPTSPVDKYEIPAPAPAPSQPATSTPASSTSSTAPAASSTPATPSTASKENTGKVSSADNNANTDGNEEKGTSIWIYVMIGVIVLIAAGGTVVILIMKKKLTDNNPAETTVEDKKEE